MCSRVTVSPDGAGSRGTFSDYPPQIFLDKTAEDDSHAEMG